MMILDQSTLTAESAHSRFSITKSGQMGADPERYAMTIGPSRPAVRVLIVDDSEDMRRLARATIEHGHCGIVVGEATDGAEAIAKAAFLQPDVVVLDLEMPWIDGIEALPHILRVAPRAVVIVWTADPQAPRAGSATELGAFAVVGKVPTSSLCAALNRLNGDPLGQAAHRV